jgi:hypothetical protein
VRICGAGGAPCAAPASAADAASTAELRLNALRSIADLLSPFGRPRGIDPKPVLLRMDQGGVRVFWSDAEPLQRRLVAAPARPDLHM